jgi:hypothetical protein
MTGNIAPVGTGGSIRNIVNASGAPSNPQIYNSILWGNGTEEITSDGTGTTTVVDSVIQGGFAGTNVVTTNPMEALPRLMPSVQAVQPSMQAVRIVSVRRPINAA